jgi:thiol:disulfide interchange protein DsbD
MPGGIDYNSLNVQNSKVKKVFQTAKSNNKKVMLIFDAVWCDYCRKLNQRVLKDAEVQKTLAGFEVINVDVDKYPEVLKTFASGSKGFDGRGVPAILIFSSEGFQMDQIVGFLETKPFNKRIKRSL